MPADPPVLTRELLAELRECWQRVQAPITYVIKPGLDDGEIDRLTAPLELTLPVEARTWWGELDIRPPSHEAGEDDTMTGAGWGFRRLERAVEEAVEQQAEVAAETGFDSWIAICWIDHGLLVIDCTDPSAPLSPVWSLDGLERRANASVKTTGCCL